MFTNYLPENMQGVFLGSPRNMQRVCLIGARLSEPHIYVKYVNSVCLSVRTFITRQFTNVVLIYGVPSTVDCSFEDDVFYTFLYQQTYCDK